MTANPPKETNIFQVMKRVGVVTSALIVSSIIVFAFSSFGRDIEAIEFLFFAPLKISHDRLLSYDFLQGMKQGEIWRLFSPMLIHFSPLHIAFNCFWCRDLGSAIEKTGGSLRFLLITLIISVAANASQFLVSGPLFGGLSGVVYGLFGYIWIMHKFKPAAGLHMPSGAVKWMIGWLLLCMTGLLGNIANTAHVVGLISGCALAWLQARRR